MPNTCSRCARRAQTATQTQTTDRTQTANRTQAANQTQTARLLNLNAETPAEEEPMRRYPHPIPTCSQTVEGNSTLSDVLTQLELQNQLLVDLMESVNTLTAALPGIRCGN